MNGVEVCGAVVGVTSENKCMRAVGEVNRNPCEGMSGSNGKDGRRCPHAVWTRGEKGM